MMNTLLGLLAAADVALMAKPVKVTTSPATGTPSNQVVHLSWLDAKNGACTTSITEEGLQSAEFDPASQSLKVLDVEGDELQLTLAGKGVPLPVDDAMVYLLIQEGGSSSELYLHAHRTLNAAEDDRISCADSGAYRTSKIINVPASLACHPQFYAIAEQLVGLTNTLDFPEGH